MVAAEVSADYFAHQPRDPNRRRYARQLESRDALSAFDVPARALTIAGPQTAEERACVPPVALLCCGPSLKDTWDDTRDFPCHSIVIAVNDAGWLNRHHWLCFSDKHIIDPIWAKKYAPPIVGCLTNKAFCGQASAHGLQAIRPETFHDGKALTKGTSYSMVAAVWWAVKQAKALGTVVHLHGYDCSHTPSVAGIDRHGSHAPARWRSEATFLRQVWDKSIVCHGRAPKGMLDYLNGITKEPVLK